jgi:radical SAM protein
LSENSTHPGHGAPTGDSSAFSQKPILVFWEATRACGLSCVHCRASALKHPLPGQLTSQEGRMLIDQVASFGKPSPTMIFTGGDPLMRGDLFELLGYASDSGVRFAVSPAATEMLNADTLKRLRDAGAAAISLSLDGAEGGTHDSVRGEPGTFRRTIEAIEAARDIGLSVQVNTTVMRRNHFELPRIFRLIAGLGIRTWEVFFLVKVGRGTTVEDLSPPECESVCNFLYDASYLGMTVRTVEAPFIRRVAMRRAQEGAYWSEPLYETLRHDLLGGELSRGDRSTINPRGTLDGDGVIFVGFDGSIAPGGLVPVPLGNVRDANLREVYQNDELLKRLRDRDLRGKCGDCAYRRICGGSRARAFSINGDALSSDPACLLAS